MIPKKITSKNGHYKIKRLSDYCIDIKHEGEKCQEWWIEGCNAPNYDMAIEEILATQEMNTRCKSDKTSHIMISFQKPDETKLTSEIFKKIEQEIAKSLGLSEHQRICGVHKDTNHIHMHIAYNLIHPEKFTINTLFQDYYKMAETCRNLEKEFGLKIDKGAERGVKKENKISQKAADMEAHSGEQSFQSYALEHKKEIIDKIKDAKNWNDVNKTLSSYGMKIKIKSTGFIIVPTNGETGAIKASSLDRSMSKKNLEKRFGDFAEIAKHETHSHDEQIEDKFQESETTSQDEDKWTRELSLEVQQYNNTEELPKEKHENQEDPQTTTTTKEITVIHTYKKNPKQPQNAERDKLYNEYQKLLEEKKRLFEQERIRNEQEWKRINDIYESEKKKIDNDISINMEKGRKRIAISTLRNQFQQEIQKEKNRHKTTINNLKEKYTWGNWNTYLKDQVYKGNTTALNVLRAQEEHKKLQEVIKYPAKENTPLPKVNYESRERAKNAGARWNGRFWFAPKGADLQKFTEWLSDKEKSKMTNLKEKPLSTRFETIMNLEATQKQLGSKRPSLFEGYKYKIDNKGNVLITLKSGGMICDSGNKLYFTPNNEDAKKAAMLYSYIKFGKNVRERENILEKGQEQQPIYKANPRILAICQENYQNYLDTKPAPQENTASREENATKIQRNDSQFER